VAKNKWIAFSEATKIVRDCLKVSALAAENLLRGALDELSVRLDSRLAERLKATYEDRRGNKPTTVEVGSALDLLAQSAAQGELKRELAENPCINEQELLAWLSRRAMQTHEAGHAVAVVPQKTHETPVDKPARRQNQRDRAQRAINILWPNGLPDQTMLPNGSLCSQVVEWLTENCKRQNIRFVPISDDTILRAAGRAR
jgi:hypothetical protein